MPSHGTVSPSAAQWAVWRAEACRMSGGSKKTHGPSWEERGAHGSLLGEGPAYSTAVGLSEPQCPHQGLELALRGVGSCLLCLGPALTLALVPLPQILASSRPSQQALGQVTVPRWLPQALPQVIVHDSDFSASPLPTCSHRGPSNLLSLGSNSRKKGV